ncbi:MAG TPA: hypothetical protein VGD36_01075 [Xanthobacteraceae bacterium]
MRRRATRRWQALSVAGALLLGSGMPAPAQDGDFRLFTHQSYIEALNRPAAFDIKDVKAVFERVLGALPERVKVYPTENYYYFKFLHGGVSYAGNIRLANEARDQGKLHFAYSTELADWPVHQQSFHALLDRSAGVEVEKLGPLEYRVTAAGKSVAFELNDLSGVKPPAAAVAPDERYIGPVFDDSGIRFFLMFNERLKIFHYVLDETGVFQEELSASKISPRVLIGTRTGFAFYRDGRRERKILVGVFDNNAKNNTYFDGPFDQLPDNFIEGEALRSAILEVEPGLKGKLDRYGSDFDGEARYLIAPYLHYTGENELGLFDRCLKTTRRRPDLYYACLALDADDPGGTPRTVAERLLRAGVGRAPARRR